MYYNGLINQLIISLDQLLQIDSFTSMYGWLKFDLFAFWVFFIWPGDIIIFHQTFFFVVLIHIFILGYLTYFLQGKTYFRWA